MNYHQQAVFIEDRLEKLAEYMLRRGRNDHLEIENESLIDMLYEHIEDNLEKFLPEVDCDV